MTLHVLGLNSIAHVSSHVVCRSSDALVLYPCQQPEMENTVKCFGEINDDHISLSSVFGCCQAHQDLPVGFLLPRYSVLFTFESLSLLYLLVIT